MFADGKPSRSKGPSVPADPCQPSRLCPRREQDRPPQRQSQGSRPDRDRRRAQRAARSRAPWPLSWTSRARAGASRPRAKVVGRRGRQTRGRAGEGLPIHPIRSFSVNGPNPAEPVRSAGRRAHRAAAGARAASAGPLLLGTPPRSAAGPRTEDRETPRWRTPVSTEPTTNGPPNAKAAASQPPRPARRSVLPLRRRARQRPGDRGPSANARPRGAPGRHEIEASESAGRERERQSSR